MDQNDGSEAGGGAGGVACPTTRFVAAPGLGGQTMISFCVQLLHSKMEVIQYIVHNMILC